MENNIDILIIEDEALIAENIRMMLEDLGYNVTGTFYTYETALKGIEEKEFDILLTDINLGYGTEEKSGLLVIEHLKKIKKCPFVFLTAFSDKETVKKAAAYYPSAYLVKPVNAANLFATVQLAVENFITQKQQDAEKAAEPDYFFIKQGTKLYKILWKDVYHLEAMKNYVRIVTPEYKNGLLLRGSMQQVLQQMMPDSFKKSFARISRSEAVKKSIIRKTGPGFIETDYGHFNTSKEFRLDEN